MNIRGIFSWFSHICIFIITVLGFFFSQVWAQNITLFYIWICFILCIIELFSIRDISDIEESRNLKIVPYSITFLVDLFITVVIVSNGWFLTGGALVFVMVFEYNIFCSPIKKLEERIQK